MIFICLSGLCLREDTYDGVVVRLSIEFSLSFLAVAHDAFCGGKDGEISAHFHAFSWEPLRAFLADDDVSWDSVFTAEEFYPSSFCL